MLITFFGKRGAGKTTAIRGQLKDCIGPVVVIDILGNFDEESLRKEKINSIQCTEIDECIGEIENYLNKNPEEQNKNKIIVLQAANPSLAVDYISAALWEACQGTLVLDEADAFEFPEAPCYDQVIRYGRNRDIHVIVGVRRPAELHRNISAAANQMYAFGTHEPRDVEYFEKTIFGTKAQKLITVPKYSGIYVDYDAGETGDFSIDKHGKIYQANKVKT